MLRLALKPRGLASLCRRNGLESRQLAVVVLQPLSRCVRLQRRALSTESAPGSASKDNSAASSPAAAAKTPAASDPTQDVQRQGFVETVTKLKDQLLSPLGVASVGGIVAIALAYKVTAFLSHITFTNVGHIAFVGGVLSAGVAAAGGYSVLKLFLLRPESIYSKTLDIVKRNEKAVAFLGGHNIHGSNFRSYYVIPRSSTTAAAASGEKKLQRGSEAGELTGLSMLNRFFPPRTMQLMFTVVGAKDRIGMVSAEVVKQGTSITYNSLYLSALDHPADKVELDGHEKEIYGKTLKVFFKE